MPRYNDTSHATQANILRKRRRWAEEMRSAGWSVKEPEETSSSTLPSVITEEELEELEGYSVLHILTEEEAEEISCPPEIRWLYS